MELGIAVARAGSVGPTWTTAHLAAAALEMGHTVYFIEPGDIDVQATGQVVARAFRYDEPYTAEDVSRTLRSRRVSRRYIRLDTLDCLLLRIAPFDASTMTFAMMAKARGVEVVNDPGGLLAVRSKAWLAGLPDVPTPPTLVTQSPGEAQMFYQQRRQAVVVKPDAASGGRAVSLVKPRRPDELEAAFYRARHRNSHVVIQAWVPEADDGELRVTWMDGEVLGAYRRTQAPGDFRHNLARGAEAHPCVPTKDQIAIVGRLTPFLRNEGIRLAGIDLIGDRIIEVNALNPGGAYHADRLNGTRICHTIIQRLDRDGGAIEESSRWEPRAL